MSDKDSSNSFMWFLAGLGFGALLGVLYAPRSGRETREAILTSAQEGKDYIKKQGREAREAVGDWVERGKDAFNRQKDHISSAIEEGRKAFNREVSGETPKRS